MRRTLSISALLGSLLLVGCSAATGGNQPARFVPLTGVPVVVTSAAASTGAPRSSDAKPLGMTQQEFRKQLSDGKSFQDLLKEKGVKVPASAAK